MALFTIVSLALVLVGPDVATRVASWLGLAPAVATAWSLLRWPVMIACVVVGVDLVYHLAPNRSVPWVWVTPGSLLATGLWIVSSFGFKIYVTNFGNYTGTYGAIGGGIVTMLWFYVSGLMILVGAELNAVIEQARARGTGARRTAPAPARSAGG
jgi:membrane protein